MKKNIVIIGGGTSGWLSASMFLKTYGDTYDITLIADEKIGNIGVGEATIPCIKEVFHFLEIPEKEWLQYCDGSFKYGIQFQKWNEDKVFTHPYYDTINDDNYQNFIKYWHYLNSSSQIPYNFDEASGVLPHLIKENTFHESIKNDIAYHFDTTKLGEFLKTWATKRGVIYENNNVKSFQKGAHGNIISLILANGLSQSVDFLIDCSGFNSLVLEGVYKQEYISFDDELLCDSCIVGSFLYDDTTQQRVPYTTAIAMDSGWMWKIPLKNRLSVGYVFSSKHIDSKKAQVEMEKLVDMETITDYRHIAFKTGYHKNAWVQNTLGIGLSYGFIEPLESTGVFLTYTSLFKALDIFGCIDSPDFNKYLKEYNSYMESLINDVKNFVVYHYLLNNKKGKFWSDARGVKTKKIFSNSLCCINSTNKEFNYETYHKSKFHSEPFFKDLSYYYILTGMLDVSEIKSDFYIDEKKKDMIKYIFYKKYNGMMASIRESRDYDSFLKSYYKD